jgi:hypothetical protein
MNVRDGHTQDSLREKPRFVGSTGRRSAIPSSAAPPAGLP